MSGRSSPRSTAGGWRVEGGAWSVEAGLPPQAQPQQEKRLGEAATCPASVAVVGVTSSRGGGRPADIQWSPLTPGVRGSCDK
eukprot:7390312-Prymnesium_polylepis.1